ncbi:cyclopropane-fatty-acyl-phospholipid synthase family protein [Sphingomonas sp. LaA6.9]|uniref:SAM-dependent methyltransferase n=1 Tax=Sphingomonas sp. LaA6.9 TaxID=2919914 RepID=UPI001F4F6DFE|nr:cyclopropane-fatty-acyl-phospholipid synthase family protein [Sphingomonas sp. LaA6.9]MCJ8158766.1 cyclopropane-fatty-acyl-phospholipid synthase family protein [Sphingomonas sp. LaA6.9]
MALVDTFLHRLVKRGTLTLTDHLGNRSTFGTPDPLFGDVAIRFADSGVAGYIVRHPRLGAAETFMDGRLIIERGDILDLITLIRRNTPWERGGKLTIRNPVRRSLSRVQSRLSRFNWEGRSKRNVAHHYDLGNSLYELFLDADMQYSCAYFTDPANSLEQAQEDKKAHIAAKLHLKPGQRVLDIGCGWGGMALYLNQHFDVDVLGITLSEEQLGTARNRAAAAGVSDRVRFELIDYRNLEGQFDRIVSVGMFEHVGPPHYREFFRQCRNLMTDDGVMLLHTIGRFGGPGTTDAFTRKYIFPGGYIPALSEVVSASEKNRLIATDVETLRLHYGLTAHHWYRRTAENRDRIVALYDERFFRMWQFYLAGAISTFEYGGMGNYQIQYVKRRDALPITRDYIAKDEQRVAHKV